MLQELRVENLLLMERAELRLGSGLGNLIELRVREEAAIQI